MESETIRQMENSLELKLISQGNTAEVYQYTENQILKLFRTGLPLELVKAEYRTAKLVQFELKNVPEVIEMIQYKERFGIVYEQINGSDMIKEMLKNLHRVKAASKSLALLHSEIHNKKVDLPDSVKKKLCRDSMQHHNFR